ncbi:hypothetical protein ILUMI_08796 [Ignelater luminosus]|uniref:Adenosine kinase n=1 Tax=Ignelater luminosus TaxID=2038154 RepID=A0A8K0D6Z6_IGNLU|nr:hypothetical protein ILUMI_08796 [Ignelater luminosus]
MVLIAGFGNPLLDITVKIPDDTLLNKYNLNEDDQKEISADKIKSLLEDISSLNPSMTPGGAAQNTMRILQWVLAKPNSTIMFGAVGQDALGKNLKALVEAAGVKTRYIEHVNEPTGTVVALVSGACRSLVAYIGAAQHVAIDNLHATDINTLNTVDLVYMEGFFLPDRKQVAQYIQEFCYDSKRIFTFNLSAVYMAETYPDDILYFANNCDILIGNYREYDALIKAAKLTMNVETLVAQLSANYDNSKNLKYGKIVIMTNGSKSVLCAHSNGKTEEISVPKIEADKIGDTTGAGDAFAAGFLAGMFEGRPPTGCLRWGCWVSRQIIQQVGCTIPNYPAEFLKTIE